MTPIALHSVAQTMSGQIPAVSEMSQECRATPPQNTVWHLFSSGLPLCRAFVMKNFHSESVDFVVDFCVNFFYGFLGVFLPFQRRTENPRRNPQQDSRQNPCKIHACGEKRRWKIHSAGRGAQVFPPPVAVVFGVFWREKNRRKIGGGEVLHWKCQRCRGKVSFRKRIALHGGVAATLTPIALHCTTKYSGGTVLLHTLLQNFQPRRRWCIKVLLPCA